MHYLGLLGDASAASTVRRSHETWPNGFCVRFDRAGTELRVRQPAYSDPMWSASLRVPARRHCSTQLRAGRADSPRSRSGELLSRDSRRTTLNLALSPKLLVGTRVREN